MSCISFDSYIKPQRQVGSDQKLRSCISFDSYIKPQRLLFIIDYRSVVYLLIPTSNHNHTATLIMIDNVVYLLIPTSNHNLYFCTKVLRYVVYLLIPTSNHNLFMMRFFCIWLYIFWFLHQTTTYACFYAFVYCCISFDSYIKPQLRLNTPRLNSVVYLLIPTSNHNRLVFV